MKKDEMVDLDQFGKYSRATLMENREFGSSHTIICGYTYDLPIFLSERFDKRTGELEQAINGIKARKHFWWNLGTIIDYMVIVNRYIDDLIEVRRLRDKAMKIVNPY